MREIAFKPIAAFRMDDNTPFQDYSGYNCTFTRTGTQYPGLPLASTASYSQLFDSTRTGSLTVPKFRTAGTEAQDSSISMVIMPSSVTDSTVFTLARTDDSEKIIFDRSSIQYQVDYQDGFHSEILRFDYEMNLKLNLVITFSPKSIYFFLNGELAYSHEISETNQAFIDFSSADTWTLTTTGRSVFLNNLCFYRSALSNEQVKSLYNINNTVSDDSTSRTFGGVEIPLSNAIMKPFFSRVWNNDADWNSGGHSFTQADTDQLHPQMEDELTVDGEWKTAVSFADPIVFPPFQWADMWYDGVNIDNVQVSLDGVTWSDISLQSPLSIISPGFDPTNTSIHIKVSFVAGHEEAHLDYLRLNIYSTNSVQINEGRTITYTQPVVLYEDQNPEDLREDWGVRVDGGTLTIGTDPSGAPINPQTVELWVKKDAGGWFPDSSLTTNLVNAYCNGFLTAAINDQWEVVHFTYSAPITTAISVSGHFSIGKVVFYPTILTLSQCNQIVRASMGTVTTTADQAGDVTMSDTAGNPTSYAYDWQKIS
jgi:hypothetical protein